MRTIKFRGRDHEGKWHVGDLIHLANICYITPDITEPVQEVDPDTIGQLVCEATDQHPEIWEGDIIEYAFDCFDKTAKSRYLVFWAEGGFYCKLSRREIRFLRRHKPISEKLLANLFQNAESRIIGNIHDHPELLKEEDEQ